MKGLACFFLAAAGLWAGPIETLEPNTWYMVPNSRMDAVRPNPEPAGNSGVASVMSAWGGGAFDTQRDRLIIWNGGHSDYSGNEMYAFSLSSLSWARIWGPSANIPSSGTSNTYPDGNPSARHTYDNLAYNPVKDAFFSAGGALTWSGSWTNGTWEFNFGTNTWITRQNVPEATMYSSTAYDAATGHIFKSGESYLNEYNPATNTWTRRASGGYGWQVVGEIDSLHRVMVFLGGGEFHVFNLQTYALSNPTPTGATEIISAYAPGLVWDSKSQKLVAWSGGSAVYTIAISQNLASYSIQKISPASGNTVTPTSAPSTGTYSKFQYCPSKNVFVGVNRTNENVYLYRLSAGTGTAAENISRPALRASISVFPNPCRGEATISLPGPGRVSIFSVSGKKVFESSRRSGDKHSALWNARGLPGGVYIVRAEMKGMKLEKELMHYE